MKNEKKVVAEREGFVLYEDGELWTTGEYAHMCGYVSDPENIETAIDAYEEECRCLMMSARAEFGF